MRIAQIAPLIESVPPKLYGGTERIVSYLTEELVAQGHDVTLFASGDSESSARFVPCVPRALRLNSKVRDVTPYYMMMLDKVRRREHDFDILHFHIDQFHFPIFHERPRRTVTTLHGRQDLSDLQALYRGFADMPLVSISQSQKKPIPFADTVGTVLHGLPDDLHAPTLIPRGGYLAFLGRISEEKGLDSAIAIARAVGLPLKIAAKVDATDQEYFDQRIKPLLQGDNVEFVGEIDETSKTRFLGDALALLFPIRWPEPFGLVMIEAFACGTPVLAFRHGAVPEVVEDGVTGFIVETVEEAICSVSKLLALNRRRIRHRFEERFTASRMAAEYVTIYKSLVSEEASVLPKRKGVNGAAAALS